MNGSPVKEIPLVPRREDDEAEGCVCDAPLEPGGETEDEDLPEARVPGLDKAPRAPKAKQ